MSIISTQEELAIFQSLKVEKETWADSIAPREKDEAFCESSSIMIANILQSQILEFYIRPLLQYSFKH